MGSSPQARPLSDATFRSGRRGSSACPARLGRALISLTLLATLACSPPNLEQDAVELSETDEVAFPQNPPTVAATDAHLPALPTPARHAPLGEADWGVVTGRGPFETKSAKQSQHRPAGGAPGEPAGPNGLEALLSVLAWVVAVLLLGGLLAYGIRYYRQRPTTTLDGTLRGVTDELLGTSEAQLATELARTLGDGDYRRAIRFRFGQVLQAMKASGLLVWLPGTTNAEYAAALPGALRARFVGLSDAFTVATYGGRAVAPEHWRQFAAAALDFARAGQIEARLPPEPSLTIAAEPAQNPHA